MRFSSGKEFLAWQQKALSFFGMSGVGKTTLGSLLRDKDWFLYSVDYRIGTRYMDEHIVDNFKREAMKVPFLANLLRNDSIYISSNITFENLDPLSTYLGKPGNPELGGLSFAEYRRRQALHRRAEIAALLDVEYFIDRARNIYNYQHFVCDSGGSLCEVVNPQDPGDPVLKSLTDNTVLIYIRGTPEHAKMLVERFRSSPKPMYYQPKFLETKWRQYKNDHGFVNDEEVDPDDFVVWGFEQLLHHRIPLYESIARKSGYVIEMEDIFSVSTEQELLELIAVTVDAQPAS